VLAALLAVVAGLLLATLTPVDGDMALTGFKALPAAVLGGFFRLRGAMLGGLLIGVVEAVASAVLPEPWQDSPAYVMGLLALPFIRRGRA
jgi:branched-chain amino acid transport system permease protein